MIGFGLWLCAAGFHRWRAASHLTLGPQRYVHCTRCLERSVRPSPFGYAHLDWDWLKGGAPTRASSDEFLHPLPTKEPAMANKPALTILEAQEEIKAKIASVEYIVSDGTMTICLIKMKNAFIVVGTSAAVGPGNFDAEVGRTIAYDNAFRQLWPLEGYLLREKLAAESAA